MPVLYLMLGQFQVLNDMLTVRFGSEKVSADFSIKYTQASHWAIIVAQQEDTTKSVAIIRSCPCTNRMKTVVQHKGNNSWVRGNSNFIRLISIINTHTYRVYTHAHHSACG